jgi:hypothetical protein
MSTENSNSSNHAVVLGELTTGQQAGDTTADKTVPITQANVYPEGREVPFQTPAWFRRST